MSENFRSKEAPQEPNMDLPKNLQKPTVQEFGAESSLEGEKSARVEDNSPAKITRRHFLHKAAVIGGAVVLGGVVGGEILKKTGGEGKIENKNEIKPQESNKGSRLEALKKPEDLPEDHFLKLPKEKLQEMKRLQWERVKGLDDNATKKILYFRRFHDEFEASKMPGFEPSQSDSSNFDYYVVDTSRLDSIPHVDPLRIKIQIPKGRKIGFSIGYHDLEKPWGRIFMDMFKKQVEYDENQVEFILVKNKNVPTGEDSPTSNKEIQEAVRKDGITNLIDIHEELSGGNHYMDKIGGIGYKWYDGERKDPNGQECTLDPFVPTWMIEQYYEGRIYPQLQYAVNDQISTVAQLIKDLDNKK